LAQLLKKVEVDGLYFTSNKHIRSDFIIVSIFFDFLDLAKILILEYNLEELLTMRNMGIELKCMAMYPQNES
jgi:hypothetical protein